MASDLNDSPIGEQKICPNPNCQFDKHSPRANFCILCGTLLYARCEDCLSENPMYANFCHYCGANLDELRAERAQQSVQSAPVSETEPRQTAEERSEDTHDKEDKGNIFDIG